MWCNASITAAVNALTNLVFALKFDGNALMQRYAIILLPRLTLGPFQTISPREPPRILSFIPFQIF